MSIKNITIKGRKSSLGSELMTSRDVHREEIVKLKYIMFGRSKTINLHLTIVQSTKTVSVHSDTTTNIYILHKVVAL